MQAEGVRFQALFARVASDPQWIRRASEEITDAIHERANLVETLSRLAALPTEPHLVTAVRQKQPLALLAHGPDWFLSEDDIFDMTRDEKLARSLGSAPAI